MIPLFFYFGLSTLSLISHMLYSTVSLRKRTVETKGEGEREEVVGKQQGYQYIFFAPSFFGTNMQNTSLLSSLHGQNTFGYWIFASQHIQRSAILNSITINS
ncbi:hypothetical protein BDB00DRAFT_812891 [Zychaea mexicana]|uniref:uncharacterized protein n=1 Tax=Zychaea mexicana TaxID=64656 RepID=UPI0022FDD8AE|nr:uncharacterized protein BDB00DRAFT_812891 [Zychaea mexicana]KAI9495666.1 hypothetical protein BDB00DRAFT_812891 [Zychaea mexicana]